MMGWFGQIITSVDMVGLGAKGLGWVWFKKSDLCPSLPQTP